MTKPRQQSLKMNQNQLRARPGPRRIVPVLTGFVTSILGNPAARGRTRANRPQFSTFTFYLVYTGGLPGAEYEHVAYAGALAYQAIIRAWVPTVAGRNRIRRVLFRGLFYPEDENDLSLGVFDKNNDWEFLRAKSYTSIAHYYNENPQVPREFRSRSDNPTDEDFATAIYQALLEVNRNLRTTIPPVGRRNYGQDIRRYRIIIRFTDFGDDNNNNRTMYRTITVGNLLEDNNIFVAGYRNPMDRFIQLFRDRVNQEIRQHRDEEMKAGYTDQVFVNSLLDRSTFDIQYPNFLPQARAAEAHEHMIFKTTPTPPNSFCIAESLRAVGYEDMAQSLEECTDIQELYKALLERNAPIAIVYNVPYIEMGFDDADENELRNTPESPYKLNLTISKRKHTFFKVMVFNPMFYYKPEIITHYIVYDVMRAHVEAAVNNTLTLENNIYHNDYMVVKYNPETKKHLLIRDFYDNYPVRPPKCPADEIVRVFFDCECVSDYELRRSLPYSVSYLIATLAELKELEGLENNYDANLAKLFIESHVHNAVGWDCMDVFVEEIVSMANERPEIVFQLVGFNNSNYDNFMLLDALQRIDSQHVIQYVDYQGASKLSNIIFGKGNCTTFDLRRHLVGSLASICKDFNIKNFAKRGDLISHLMVQRVFCHNEKEEFFEKLYELMARDRLEEYNNYDVLSLALAFYRYVEQMEKFNCLKIMKDKKAVYESVSLPSYMYAVACEYNKLNQIELATPSFSQYKFLRKSCTGGRVQTFNNEGIYEEEVVALDVTSLYPYAMYVKPVYYPCGEMVDEALTPEKIITLNNQLHSTGSLEKIGFYTVNIDQTIQKTRRMPVIICAKTKEGENKWEYEDDVLIQKSIVLNTVDIEALHKYGCGVEFVAGERCIVYQEKVRSFDLFGWMTDLMIEKNKQDAILRDEGADSPNYSSVVRNLCKMASNSLSGKFVEKAHEKQMMRAKADEYFANLTKSKNMVEGSDEFIGFMNDKTVIVQYRVKPECIKAIKPTAVGSLIYAHSRFHMTEHFLQKFGYKDAFGRITGGQSLCLYTDTDSVKLFKKNYHLLQTYLESTNIPHWHDIEAIAPNYAHQALYEEGKKENGGFAHELDAGNNLNIFQGKKSYASFTIDHVTNKVKLDARGKALIHFSMKGVQPSAIIIDDVDACSAFIEKSHITNNQTIISQVAALEYAHLHPERMFKHADNVREVFTNLLQGKDVYIMNCIFERQLLNNTVAVTYALKRIQSGDSVLVDALLSIDDE